MEVRAAQPDQLRIGVREQPALEERVVAEVDPRHDVADVERDLLGLREEVVGVPVEGQLADPLDRHQLLRDQLRRVEEVEAERELVLLLDDLQAELPLREVPCGDRLPQVAPVEIRVLARDLLGLVPGDRMDTEERLPVELHEA